MRDESDLAVVVIHATAALRRKRDALQALDRRRPDHDDMSLDVAVGEASQGVLSLFLAADAATRLCERHPTRGPFGRGHLARLLKVTGHFRDSIMHWDDKGQSYASTSLHVGGQGLVVDAPEGRSKTTKAFASISWNEYERAAGRLAAWAQRMTDIPADEM